jgi:hypothetical protein
MKMPLEDGAPDWFHEAVSQPRSAHTLRSRDSTALHLAGWNAGQAGAAVGTRLPRQCELPAAHHHLMLDQPLALVATLRCLLACPPR